jgi:hypothetical protein
MAATMDEFRALAIGIGWCTQVAELCFNYPYQISDNKIFESPTTRLNDESLYSISTPFLAEME